MIYHAMPSSDTDFLTDSLTTIEDLLQGLVVIIPALNEEKSLPLVLRDLPANGCVIVVDNGSTDATSRVARQLGAKVVFEERRGYGAACLAGLAAVESAVRAGAIPRPEAIGFLDADYSDSPEFLAQLAVPVLQGQVDFALGSRLLGSREPGAMPLQSIWGNRFACLLLRWFWGASYTDLGPFRVINYAALKALKMQDRSFGWTIEMQIKAVLAGLRIQEIPVPYRCRIGQSKISGTLTGSIKAGYKILSTIVWYRFSTYFRWVLSK